MTVRRGSLTVVGTGIDAVSQLTPAARGAIEGADEVFYLLADPMAARRVESLNPTREFPRPPLRRDEGAARDVHGGRRHDRRGGSSEGHAYASSSTATPASSRFRGTRRSRGPRSRPASADAAGRVRPRLSDRGSRRRPCHVRAADVRGDVLLPPSPPGRSACDPGASPGRDARRKGRCRHRVGGASIPPPPRPPRRALWPRARGGPLRGVSVSGHAPAIDRFALGDTEPRSPSVMSTLCVPGAGRPPVDPEARRAFELSGD